MVEGGEAIALDRLRQVRVVAAGKAAAAMLNALLARLRLPTSCELQGVLIAPERPENLPATIQYFCGGHPVPNAASFEGARPRLAMLHAVGDAPVHSISSNDTLSSFLSAAGHPP